MDFPPNSPVALITTNGMFIIDDIYEKDGRVHKDVPGGGGMFAMLGACIVSTSPTISRGIKWIVDKGRDFPDSLTTIITSWGSGVYYRDDFSRETTRGWNFYENEDHRKFKYLTPKKQITVQDWFDIWGRNTLAQMKCIHLLCSPERCLQILDELQQLHSNQLVFVWEPIPDLCDEAHLQQIRRVLNRSETIFFSPNAEEGARLFGDEEPLQLEECLNYVWKFEHFIASQNSCVLRCGKHGSVALSSKDPGSGKRSVFHYPAYHELTPESVQDPTGGGNSYLGGFCLGYSMTKDLQIASICGNIAAGCVIEQLGVPNYDKQTRRWNGLTLQQRLRHYIDVYKIDFAAEYVYNQL